MSTMPNPDAVLRAGHSARRHMQGYRDQLRPTLDGAAVTDRLTIALLVSCYGTNRHLQPKSFQDLCEEVRNGPPNRKATGSDIIAQLKVPPEANVRISYREHRIRATLSFPGIMVGTGDVLILNTHAPNAITTGWAARVGDEDEPLTIADIVPGLPALLVSTMERSDGHTLVQYVDDEIAWHDAKREIAGRTKE